MHLGIVGDHRHERFKRIFLLVEREDLLAEPGGARGEAARQLGDVVRVRRAAVVEHHIIGDVDQRRNCPLPGRLQPPLHPLGRGAVFHALDRPAEESGAAARVLDTDRYRAREAALDLGHGKRFQRPDAGGGEVARNSPHAHAILPVWRDVDVEHWVVEAGVRDECRSDRCIGWQLDNPAMVVAKLELTRRAHHAVAFDPADRRDLQRQVAAGDVRTRRSEHAEQSGAGVGRSAHHLDLFAGARIDGQHLKLVGLRMLLRGQHLGDAKWRQRYGPVADLLHLQPDGGKLVGDLLSRSICVEVVLQPFQREFHAPTPPDSVGTSSARNP